MRLDNLTLPESTWNMPGWDALLDLGRLAISVGEDREPAH